MTRSVLISLLLLPLLLSSCIVTINENGYRQLSKAQKARLQPYHREASGNRDSTGAFVWQEITAEDVAGVKKDHAYTWVHVWIPYCRAPRCYPPSYYERILQSVANRDVAFLLVSQIYDVRMVARIIDRFSYSRPVYVIRDTRYGHSMRKSRTRFTTELTGSDSVGRYSPNDLLFKGNRLVYAGDELTKTRLDSVLAGP